MSFADKSLEVRYQGSFTSHVLVFGFANWHAFHEFTDVAAVFKQKLANAGVVVVFDTKIGPLWLTEFNKCLKLFLFSRGVRSLGFCTRLTHCVSTRFSHVSIDSRAC